MYIIHITLIYLCPFDCNILNVVDFTEISSRHALIGAWLGIYIESVDMVAPHNRLLTPNCLKD